MAGIDHLVGQRARSESVQIEATAPDGRADVTLRLCRYPAQRTAWLWVDVAVDGHVYTHYDHALACGDAETDVDAEHVRYAPADAAVATFERFGARDGIARARARVAVGVFDDAHAAPGPGPLPLEVEAEIRPRHAPHATFRGRIEALGDVEARVRLGERSFVVSGLGHWHEQHQEAPRFLQPFIYASLRGEGLLLVLTKTARRDTGFVVRGGELLEVTGVAIDPPGPRRALRLTLRNGETIEGVAERRYDYSVPLWRDWRRPGSIVSGAIGGIAVSGCINDWAGPPAGGDA